MLMHLDRILDGGLNFQGHPCMAAVNTHTLYWNPVLAADAPMAKIRAVLLHESFHLILQHLGRLKGRNPVLWNYVGDKKCNQYTREINDERASVDVTGLILPESDELQMTTEELYRKYLDNATKVYITYVGPDCPISGEGSKSDKNDPQSDVETQIWNNRIRDLLSKEAGKLPGSLKRELEEFLNPEVPWQELLREYACEAAGGMTDFTWKHFNRMYRVWDFYYPGMKGEKVNVFLAADTSGSMGRKQLDKVFTESNSILEDFGDVYYIAADAQIQGEPKRLNDIKELVAVTTGGGGTDFRPVFDHVDEMYYTEEIPPVLIYMTDGYGPFPEQERPYPVIWLVIDSDVVAPFGRTIKVESKSKGND
jgi:predicted metal-dependent peptidase